MIEERAAFAVRLADPSRPALLAAAFAVLALGCRYQDMNARGALGAAPFADLQCFEEDNPEGFSLEVPACECAGGMRLRYYARLEPGPADIHYEFETGFRDDDRSDDVRMISATGETVDRLFIGSRELPPYEEASAVDRTQWELARLSFSDMVRNYRPILDRGFDVCTEDRVEREAARRRRSRTP